VAPARPLPNRTIAGNAWAAGLLDSDGTMVMTQDLGRVRVRISVDCNLRVALLPLPDQFGGAIHLLKVTPKKDSPRAE
jgi:hypothetical protein